MKEIFISPKIKVKPSSLHGMGVFAIEDILKGEVVEVCYCTIDETKKIGETILRKYMFTGWKIVWGYGSIYNHSFKPNLKFNFISQNIIEFKAIKNILNGEELTHAYTTDKEKFKKVYL